MVGLRLMKKIDICSTLNIGDKSVYNHNNEDYVVIGVEQM